MAIVSISFVSCVSSKKFKKEKEDHATLIKEYALLQSRATTCEEETARLNSDKQGLEAKIADLNRHLDYLKQHNTQALQQLEDLSVISATQAASIKKSLENLGARDAYILSLEQQMARKDSLNKVLVMNLKGAIGDLNDRDIDIKVDKGVVYIDISDQLLFKSGSYDITARAGTVLAKVAAVLKNQPEIEFMVEGHTDNVSFRRGVLVDNWDLSVKRATSVVRVLQQKYGLSPAQIAAAGRGEFKPVASNDTNTGRAANRRTRIIVLPQLDQFFQLLSANK